MSSSSAINVTGTVSNFFRRNYLVNGSFNLWQRGMTFSGIVDGVTKANIYTADRWIVLDGGGTESITRGSFTKNQTSVPEYPDYYMSYSLRGITKSGTPAIMQKLGDATQFAGKTISFSFYANVLGLTFNPLAGSTAATGVSSGYIPATIRVRQFLGSGASGGGMTHDTIQYTQAVRLYANAWRRYSASFTMNTLVGKTLGTVGTDFTSFELRLPMVVTGGVVVSYLPGTTYGDPDVHAGFTSSNITGYTLGFTLGFANAQVDLGHPSSYERREVSTDLPLAQQFYQKTFAYDLTPANALGITAGAIPSFVAAASNIPAAFVNLKTKMRTTPSVTFYNIGSTAGHWSNGVTAGVLFSNSESLVIGCTAATVTAPSYVHLAADAEI